VRVHGWLADDRGWAMLMEPCHESLLDVVNRQGALSQLHARHVLKQLLSGLKHCHDSGVAHQDVKLENVLIDGDGACRLADFDLAIRARPRQMVSAACGSAHYMAPEVFSGALHDAELSDVWSLGVCFYAMMSAQLPFRDADDSTIRNRVCSLACPPAMPLHHSATRDERELDLLARMMHPRPHARWRLADILLHEWISGERKRQSKAEEPSDAPPQPPLAHPRPEPWLPPLVFLPDDDVEEPQGESVSSAAHSPPRKRSPTARTGEDVCSSSNQPPPAQKRRLDAPAPTPHSALHARHQQQQQCAATEPDSVPIFKRLALVGTPMWPRLVARLLGTVNGDPSTSTTRRDGEGATNDCAIT